MQISPNILSITCYSPRYLTIVLHSTYSYVKYSLKFRGVSAGKASGKSIFRPLYVTAYGLSLWTVCITSATDLWQAIVRERWGVGESCGGNATLKWTVHFIWNWLRALCALAKLKYEIRSPRSPWFITPYSDIPEGCVLVGPRNSRFFIFSDRLLAILHAMYLVSNKVASN